MTVSGNFPGDDPDSGGRTSENGRKPIRIEPRLLPLKIATSALKYAILPVTIIWFFPGADSHPRELLFGLNRDQIIMAVVLVGLCYFPYRFYNYIARTRRNGGSNVVIDETGVFCKERNRLFRWADMFNVSALGGDSLLDSADLSITHKDPIPEGESSDQPTYSSYSWRLDATDVDVSALHGLVCELHRKSKHPDDLYLR